MAGLLTAAEIADLQSIASTSLDKSCDIYRKTAPTADVYGSQVPNYTKIATTTCGMAQPSANHLTNYDFMIGSEASWLVRLPKGTDIHYQDHIVVESQTLEVHVLLTPQSYSIFTNVLCAEIV